MSPRPEPHPENADGDFYVELGCCITCGIPLDCAPRTFDWSEGGQGQCIVRRQPASASEVEDVLEAMRCAEVDCIRYRGADLALRDRIGGLGLQESCDPLSKAQYDGMLTVIIDARPGTDRLPALLAQLTAGAVDGLVRQVLIVARADQAGIDLLCEETGAGAHPTIAAAARDARAERVMVLPADFRLRDGWIGALEAHLTAGGAPAVVVGLQERRGLFARAPTGALVERGALEQVADGVAVGSLRRLLRLGGRRIG